MAATTAAAATTTAAVSTATKDRATIGQTYDQFLKLLTTQLKNQDPLSPMDSTQFTNQLVSFSQVEQQIRSNENLQKLINLSSNNQTTTALSYIGLNVDMNGSNFQYGGTGNVKMSYEMPADATIANYSVLDADNNVVSSGKAELAKGTHLLTWNGLDSAGNPAPAGNYHLSIGAQDIDKKAILVNTVVPGQVTGIETETDGTIKLLIGNQKISLTDVRKATLPGI